jgi:hypothetical protein
MQVGMDLTQKNRLITGEKLSTKLAVRNIYAVQKARLLSQLISPSSEDMKNLLSLDDWIAEQCFTKFCAAGECRHSTMAYLRYLGTFEDETTKERVETFIRKVSAHRDGKGRWKGFPFYYTLLVLHELNTEAAREELDYAIPACRRAEARIKVNDDFYSIRHDVLSNALRLTQHALGNFLAQDFPRYKTL